MRALTASRYVTAASALLIVPACGSSSGQTAQNVTRATAQSAEKQPVSGGRNLSRALSVNVSGISYGSRTFMNLIYGSTWQMQDTTGQYSDVPANFLDRNGWVKNAPDGTRIVRSLSVPLNAASFICRYEGNGTLTVSGAAVSNAASAAGSTRFSIAATYPNAQAATLSYVVDPKNYIRNIDCREVNASVTGTIATDFKSALSPFSTIRFMKWQTATEGNWPVTWATRNKPGDGDYSHNDGVPIEVIVQTANQADADLWVTVPWNADNDYITKFAAYVHDNLAAGHQVYVEVSNEVWNGAYPVATQALNEAKSENLPSATGAGTGGSLERYAEKTKRVMEIWSAAFSGQNSKLVRVASFQHVSPYYSDLLLKYMNLSQSVDALATAPYFGYEAKDGMSLDQIMAALPAEATASVNVGVQQKAVAQKYGLRYLTYESGQAVVLPNNLPLEQQVERDPRMHDVYQQFITSWQSQIGGGLNLFALEGQIGKYGGWGLSEYVGQPLSQTPKLRAVHEFLGLDRPLKR